MSIEEIRYYFEQQDSVYIDIATVMDSRGEVYIMVAPKYTTDNNVELYDEHGNCYTVLHCVTADYDDIHIPMLLDLCNKNICIAKGKVIRREF